MKNNFKKIIILSVLVFTFFVSGKVEASSLLLKPSNTMMGIGEQFYVDVMLDTGGKRVNGIEGSIKFPPENISFIRAEEGASMISLWVEKPALEGDSIHFAGVIPNGFDGVIDPFNPKVKLPGLIIRLVFEGKKEGDPIISSSQFYTTLNDGLGTMDNIAQSDTKLFIQNISNPIIYKTKNDTSPELKAYVTRDPNLFDNKYVLVFDAKDNKTGIKEVLIKEGRGQWKKIESPYLLEDQTRHSIITLQATNYSDVSITMTIESLPYNLFSVRNILVAVIFVFISFVLLFFIKKIYEKYKNTHN
jgi:hypothetical protein